MSYYYWSYANRKDRCDEHSITSGNSYLAISPPPIDLPMDVNGNFRFLLFELILWDLPPIDLPVDLNGDFRFLACDRMSVASLCSHDLSVGGGGGIIVICEHSWPHAWPNKVHTLHAHAAISCIMAHQKLYHSELYLLYSSHICMFILMSKVHEVINIATSNLTKTCIEGSFTYQQKMRSLWHLFFN